MDAPLVDLIELLNGDPDWVTTSSCSGRISLLLQPPGVRKGGEWLYVSHDRAEEGEVLAAVAAAAGRGSGGGSASLRFEPLIVTLAARSQAAAARIMAIARAAGLRESGLTRRVPCLHGHGGEGRWRPCYRESGPTRRGPSLLYLWQQHTHPVLTATHHPCFCCGVA